MKFCNSNFDEKQILERGKAYKIAYFTLLFAVFVAGLICSYIFDDMTIGYVSAIVIILSVGIFGCIAIKNDAFEGVIKQSKGIIVLYTSTAALFIIMIHKTLVKAETFNREIISELIMYSTVALMELIIGVFWFVKRKKEDNCEKKDSEE